MIKKIILIVLFVSLSSEINCQNLEGLSGLYYIPTAKLGNDGEVNFGISSFPKNYISFGGYKYSAYTPFITITFLPFFEVSLRITRLINVNNQAIGDRTLSTKFRLCDEGELTPSITIGFHDILSAFGGVSAIHNNALYIVSSKSIALQKRIICLGLHVGYGTDKIKAEHHNFVGLFGGISLRLFNDLEVMTEYDGKYPNGGLRIKLFDHITVLGGLLRYKYFSGSISFGFVL